HDEVTSLLLPARQIEPAQERLASTIALTIETGYQHVIELEAFRAVDRQDLHRRSRARPRLGIEICQHGIQRADSTPLARRRALTQGIEESARVSQLLQRIRVGSTKGHPHAFQPVRKR